MTTYQLCKTVITNKTYKSKENMKLKLDIFILNDSLTKIEYDELVSLLNEQI